LKIISVGIDITPYFDAVFGFSSTLSFRMVTFSPMAAEISSSAGAMGDKVKIVKLNVDESPKTASKYGVMSIPTLMIFKGGEMASRQVGAAPKAKLQQWITASV
jgi:thioredoxin-like negative regulator of GroEL